jgi:DNA-binding NtrC family response regulator
MMKILVVDDQRSARRVLRQVLGALEDVEIIEAGNVNDAMAAIELSTPDLLLLEARSLEDGARERAHHARGHRDLLDGAGRNP